MLFQESEGAKFWMQVLSDLKTRGVSDILICCVDGLKGFPDAIEAIFPITTIQTCVVHLIRTSLRYVPRREREQVARDLKPIYTATDADQAHAELELFDEKWGARFPRDHPSVAERLGVRDPVSRVPGRGPPRDLHDG
jgi:transposase-like protein